MRLLKRPYFWIVLLAACCGGVLLYIALQPSPLQSNQQAAAVAFALRKVDTNYGTQVDALSVKLGLPANYIKALILLECSANDPPGSRYEAQVFEKLQAVQRGEIAAYSGIRQEHLRGKSRTTLQQFATSWGPLQIMGYHSIHLGIHIDELKGDKSLYHGMKWVKQNYGHLLKKKAYQDAFHFHNTGKLYPKFGPPLTYDRYYVGNGLLYMQKLAQRKHLPKRDPME
ncbi:hypothetical protein [Rhodoflexus sp.]